MEKPVTFFEIAGKDGEKLNNFYSDVFGWEIQANPYSGSYMIQSDSEEVGIDGHILQVTEDMGFNNHVTIYVQVEDLQSSLEKAEGLGGKTLIPPQEIPGDSGTFAIFLDPSGNYLGLYQLPEGMTTN